MKLIVLTPDEKAFEGEVERVVLPGVDGDFEVLVNHAPLISALGEGEVMITAADKQVTKMKISGGFFEVLNNNLSLAAEQVIAE
ncbi:MAG: ATP synthase F1 subunit epsilon [Saprospiraceae bacterium]|nr:ATP synthase F1 subunit epsilon [Saprospiraceae bacterium]